MNRHITAILSILTFVCAGCNTAEPEEVLLPREDISLTIRGKLHISFSSDTFQTGFNEQRNEFRVTDDKLGEWFVLRCSEMPVETGQELNGSLEYSTDTVPQKHDRLTFSVQKMSDDGLIWLWNETRKIGIVVKRP